MVSSPFIVFYLIGMIFQLNLDYLVKLGAFMLLYIGAYTAKRFLFDERLYNVLPMATYLATKVSYLVTTVFK